MKLQVPVFVAPLVAPAVDLTVLGLLVGTRHLAPSGASDDVLRPARRLLLAASVVTLLLNVADPREAELRLFRDRAQARGAEGLPVADFVEAYFCIAEVLWQELSRLAEDTPPPEAVGMLLGCLHRVLHVAVAAHQQEFQAAHSEEYAAVRVLVRALVAGEPARDLAHRFGIRLTADTRSSRSGSPTIPQNPWATRWGGGWRAGARCTG